MRTLLIDDDPFALRLLQQQLLQLGRTTVTLCQKVQEAMDLLSLNFDSIDLVFCDLQMPGIDGVEFVRHLGRIGYQGDLVLVSGEDSRVLQTAQTLVQAHGIQLLGALAKPVSAERLREVLAVRASRRAQAQHPPRRLYGADALRQAIVGGQLVNHYQPKVEMAGGALVGVEALVRWQHPTAGLVFPDQFIAVAEEHGLIDDLTHAVLAAALQQARLWQDAGLALRVAVNVSMDNLAALDFPDRAAALAQAAGVPLSMLMLEVTESRLMKDARSALDVLTRLHLKRIGLSIDDFGTGHSSLVQLRDVPFDELKLDRSFVNGAGARAELGAIVEGTLAMAQQLGMKSVAEGVEDRADWDFMRSRGCDVAQGYFIARPMPAADLPAWCATWERRRADLTAATP